MAVSVAEQAKVSENRTREMMPRVRKLVEKAREGEVDASALGEDVLATLMNASVPVVIQSLKDDDVRREWLQATKDFLSYLPRFEGLKLFLQISGREPAVMEVKVGRALHLYLDLVMRISIFLNGLPFYSRAFSWFADRFFGLQESGGKGPGLLSRLITSRAANWFTSRFIINTYRTTEEEIRRAKIPGLWINAEFLEDVLEDDLILKKGPQLMQKIALDLMAAIDEGGMLEVRGMLYLTDRFDDWNQFWRFLDQSVPVYLTGIFSRQAFVEIGERLSAQLDSLLQKYGC